MEDKELHKDIPNFIKLIHGKISDGGQGSIHDSDTAEKKELLAQWQELLKTSKVSKEYFKVLKKEIKSQQAKADDCKEDDYTEGQQVAEKLVAQLTTMKKELEENNCVVSSSD